MIRDLEWIVPRDQAGLRLDKAVARRFSSCSRSAIGDAIRGGAILLNGRISDKSRTVADGDQIRVVKLAEDSDRRLLPDASAPLDIVFQDEHLLVLNKPAGMPVHPLRTDETGTLANGLVTRFPAAAAIGDDPLFPSLVHRLDTETSGLIVAALQPAAYDALRKQFRTHRVRKVYAALAHGRVSERLRLDQHLAYRDQRRARLKVVPADVPGAMRAMTEVEPVESFPDLTLLRVTISTGVTHQIRCQLAHAGHPLVGDKVYCARTWREQVPLPRQFLHASEIRLAHPADGRMMEFACPLPADLESLLTRLRA